MNDVAVSQMDYLKVMGHSSDMKESFRIRYMHANTTVNYSYEKPNVISRLTWKMIRFEVR
jgi:hypothetical protein